MTKRTHSLAPHKQAEAGIRITHCGIRVFRSAGLIGETWAREGQLTNIGVVDANPSCMNCKANAALAARKEAERVKPITADEVLKLFRYALHDQIEMHALDSLAKKLNERFGVK